MTRRHITRRINIFIFIIALFISGNIYAVNNVDLQQFKAKEGNLFIIRDKKIKNHNFDVYLNDTIITNQPKNTFFSTKIKIGIHTIKINNDPTSSLKLNIKEDCSTFIFVTEKESEDTITLEPLLIDSISGLSIINNSAIKDISKEPLLTSNIIFYTENSSDFNISINSKQAFTLNGKSSFSFKCEPGTYTIGNEENQSILKLHVNKNKIYYVNISNTGSKYKYVSFNVLTNFDEISNAQKIVYGKLKKSNNNDNNIYLGINSSGAPSINVKESKKLMTSNYLNFNRIGINIDFGKGFEKKNIVKLTSGETSSISYGGGIAFGLKYGHEIDHLDLLGEYNYTFSMLIPSIDNGNVYYRRSSLSFTPSYIQFINWKNNFKIRYGGGIDYYFGNNLDVKLSELLENGMSGNLKYKDAIGAHLQLSFEAFFNDNFSVSATGKLYTVKYEYKEGYLYDSKNRQYIPSEYLKKTDGSGIDIQFSFNYYF